MTNELVLIVRADSGIRSKAKLSGKTLAIDVGAKYMDALDSDADLKSRLGKVSRLTGGAQACFAALDSGEADAVIVYSVAARYYGK
jgi:ABC-type amino acid transport substrate-binding protein